MQKAISALTKHARSKQSTLLGTHNQALNNWNSAMKARLIVWRRRASQRLPLPFRPWPHPLGPRRGNSHPAASVANQRCAGGKMGIDRGQTYLSGGLREMPRVGAVALDQKRVEGVFPKVPGKPPARCSKGVCGSHRHGDRRQSNAVVGVNRSRRCIGS